ncbi:hypothetical protein [Halorussus sp. GCM10023401]
MVAIVLAYVVTEYLTLWEVGSGEWSVADLGFSTGLLSTVALGIIAAFIVAPFFYGVWQLVDRRYGDQRPLLQIVGVWAVTGLIVPAVVVAVYILSDLDGIARLITSPELMQVATEAWESFTTAAGKTLCLSLFPSLFTGVYHRFSTGDWTVRTRRFHVTVAVVLVVLVAAVGASATLSPTSETAESSTDISVADPSDPAAYGDGLYGPSFDPAENVNQSYGEYQSGTVLACGSIDSPKAVESYTPKQTYAGPKNFEIAPGQINTESSVVTLDTRYSVRLTDWALRNATIINSGYYGENPTDHNYWVGTTSYDEPGGYDDIHDGLRVPMENVESVHVYVDVVRDGEIHRYVTAVCPNGGGSGGA